MFQRILVVCVGNICRSPTAERLFQHYLPNATVSSAGIGALVGKPMDPTALAVLEEHGIDGGGHKARQLDDALIREADLILGMEQSHLDTIARRAPHATGRVFLLDKWGQQKNIPDPYRQQRPAFEHVYTMIDRAVQGWLPYLDNR